MKVLFLSDDFPPRSFGGAGISTYELAKGVQKAGHEVSVITVVRKGSEAGEDNFEGLKVFKIANDYKERWRPYLSLYNPPVVRQVKRILKEISPDIVHVNNVHRYLSYHSIKLSKKMSKGVVMTFRDTMAFTYGKLETKKYLNDFDTKFSWIDQLRQAKKRWNPLRNFIIRRYLKHLDIGFANSESLRESLERNGIKNVEVMHTGIDLKDYAISDKQLSGKTVFFAGRLSEAKGAKVVEEAMKIVLKEIPLAKLITAGSNGDWLDREDMKRTFAESDLVLVPSLYLDAFPRIMLEAMALARPVVGTCYGGVPEAIEDGVTGYVVNPLDTQKMAEKISELLKDPKKAENFGKAAHKRIEVNFNLSDRITKLISIYEELL